MNEKELGRRLLHGEEQSDVTALTERILRRDRRRVLILGSLCIIAWMFVALIPWATILPMLARVLDILSPPGTGAASTTLPIDPENRMRVLLALKKGIEATFIGSLVTMLIAALCTVSLVNITRRATLRQVNSRLEEISEQLKALAKKD